MNVNRKEIARYLGYHHANIPDQAVENLIEECLTSLENACRPRHVAREFSLSFYADGTIDGEFFQLKSKSLSVNLKGCERIIAFCATLGIEADRLISHATITQMSRAVVYQACTAAMIESYCDEINAQFAAQALDRGYHLRPRFSPGYGDFPLTCQPSLIAALGATKQIGVSLTTSMLMMPSKSVTAIIGLNRDDAACSPSGCDTCKLPDCPYKREP